MLVLLQSTRDEHLLLGISVFLVVDLIILVTWSVVDPIVCSRHVVFTQYQVSAFIVTFIVHNLDGISRLSMLRVDLINSGIFFCIWVTPIHKHTRAHVCTNMYRDRQADRQMDRRTGGRTDWRTDGQTQYDSNLSGLLPTLGDVGVVPGWTPWTESC